MNASFEVSVESVKNSQIEHSLKRCFILNQLKRYEKVFSSLLVQKAAALPLIIQTHNLHLFSCFPFSDRQFRCFVLFTFEENVTEKHGRVSFQMLQIMSRILYYRQNVDLLYKTLLFGGNAINGLMFTLEINKLS